jgi:hypothetical protein
VSQPYIPSARERDERLKYWLDKKSSMEIASEIVDRWAHHEKWGRSIFQKADFGS